MRQHHWDAIGVLVPSERTAAGHRRSTGAGVRHLYRMVALDDVRRAMGAR